MRSTPGLAAPAFCAIPGGEFWMGDAQGRHDEQPAHRVRLRAFLLAKFPVTNEQYGAYLTATGALEPRFWQDERFNQPRQPVVGISWFEAVAYCEWLSETAGQRFRLPTEAEHEWAARGGLEGGRYSWGNEEPDLVGAWGRGRLGQDRPLPVSDASPNGFGLCHMTDNVHEWCSDWYDAGYYAVSTTDDPQGAASGTRRASRGGAWRHELKFSRCAARSSLPPHLRYNDYGFRIVLAHE